MKICCPCNNNENISNGSNDIFCPGCETFQHKDCITPCDLMETYVCPSCQLWKTDLYMRKIRNVLPPRLFDDNVPKGKKELNFSFTPDFSFFPTKTGNRPNYLVIRCLQLKPEGFKLSLPLPCELKINNKVIVKKTAATDNFFTKPILMWLKEMPQSVRTPYRKKPLQIKNYITDKQENLLTITVEKNSKKEIYKYIISIDYVAYRPRIEDVIQTAPKISNREDIKNLLTRKNELNLISKVSLVDNYTTIDELKLPIRGFNCLHIQAFDLYKFIHLNKDVLKYRCPICNKKSNIFYIDMYLKDIIEKYYKQNKKVVFLDENLKIDENYRDNVEENNMMEIDDDCIEDIDNGEDKEENEEEDKNENSVNSANEIFENNINEENSYFEEGELTNEDVIQLSDDTENEPQREVDVESMMMHDIEEQSNEEPINNNIPIEDKEISYNEDYKKRIEKIMFQYKDDILSILHCNKE